PDGASVKFKHLRTPLRIIATDISRRKLKLFSEKATPEESVARAVAASAALPFAFKARIFGKGATIRTYVDGGLVSNLPAWTSDEERALDPDALTVAVEIDDGLSPSHGVAHRPLKFLSAVSRSAIFGAGILEKRGASRLLVIPMLTDTGVLDFGMSRERAQ